MAALAVATGAALLIPATGRSQTAAGEALVEGRVELSTALSLNVVKESGDSESSLLLNVPLRVGCMLNTQFELEAELLLTHSDDGGFGDTGVSGAAHVIYHFTPKGNTVPFLLAGGGYGNAVGIGNIAAPANVNPWLLQAGAGVKLFAGRHAALRAEYRLTHYSGSAPGFCEACPHPPPAVVHFSAWDNSVLVGISLWP